MVVDVFDAFYSLVMDQAQGLKAELIDPQYGIPGEQREVFEDWMTLHRAGGIRQDWESDLQDGFHHFLAEETGHPESTPAPVVPSFCYDHPQGIPPGP
jgi:hypothetical protein